MTAGHGLPASARSRRRS